MLMQSSEKKSRLLELKEIRPCNTATSVLTSD